MKKNLTTIIATVVITAIATALVSVYMLDSTGLPIGFAQIDFVSEVLQEEREVIIAVPDSYDRTPGGSYPVVFVLGGSTLTFHVAESVDMMSRIEVMPEVIVVGLPNPSQKTRQRDLTPSFMRSDLDEEDSEPGAADEYLSFIEHEVIPLIDSKYRTSSCRMAIGHSREGLCLMYSLMTKPSLFDARFVYSPALWRENNIFVTKLDKYLLSCQSLDTFVYLSLGDGENE